MSIFKDNTIKKTKAEYEEERLVHILERREKDREKNNQVITPFCEIAKRIIGNDNYKQFEYKTGLSANMYYDIQKRKGKDTPCQKSTIVSLCIGYGMGLQVANELLKSEGSAFIPNCDRDEAYIILLTEFRDKSIDECNYILEKMNIKPSDRLGQYARKPRCK